MSESDTYVCAERLNLNNHLYEIGESVPASAFEETNEKTGLRHIHPQTPEQLIADLRAAGVLKLPLELQQAIDVQAALDAKQAEIEALQAQLAEMQALQQVALPATVAQKKGATGKGVDVAPAAESAPLSE